MLVRYSNCKAWLGLGLGFSDSITVEDSLLSASDRAPDRVVDCGGNTVIPAFVDSHMHPILAGRESLGPQVTSAASIEEVQQILRQWISQNNTEVWVVGGAYNRSIASDGIFHAAWLDEVSNSQPIVLHADDHHTIWVNSLAMELAGVTTNSPRLSVAGVDLDVAGAPVGTFRESDAKNLILNAIPSDGGEADQMAIDWSQKEMLSWGITSVLDAWVDQDLATSYISAAQSGLLEVATNLAFWLEPDQWKTQLSEAAKTRVTVEGLAAYNLSASTVKLFIDGVFGSATAFVSEPYLSTGKFGSRFWEPEQLQEVCQRASELGFQLHLHAIGDAAVGAALDALERCSEYWLEATNRPPVLAHVELLADSDLVRVAQLGVGVNLQPLWSRLDDLLNSCRRHLGDRVESLYRTRDLLDNEVSVAFGSDWPVSSVNPFLGLYTAISRRIPRGSEYQNPEQAISLEQALHAYTYEGSKQLGLFGRGTLEPGQRADFLILSDDPFENPESLPGMFVLETISGGQTRFTRH